MTRPAFKLLCYLVFIVQALAVSGFARGSYVCQHSDGTSQVESLDELAECHARQELADHEAAAVVAKECVDSPVVTEAAPALKSPTAGSVLLDIHHAPLVLPAFFTPPTDLFARPRATYLDQQTRALPDVERASLGSVILVI
jgi:hypothetical protein